MRANRVRAAWIGALLVAGLPAVATAQFRTIDGTGNNPLNPAIGSANIPLLRKTTVEYGNGTWTPAGATRPSARAVSNDLSAQVGSVPNAASASDFVWQWGQFLDHDLDLTTNATPCEAFNIPVPAGDPFFDPTWTGTQVIAFCRSIFTVDRNGVRQQTNEITAWIDASNVYGSDQQRADALRTFDGTGRLAVTPHPDGPLLPFNVNGLPNAMPQGANPASFFLAGDVRSNEQVALTAMHTLFVREHNFWALLFHFFLPSLSGDIKYQLARMIVAAEMQAITYNEFLPVLLGPNALRPYRGYDPRVDAGIANFFSTASFRYGHSQLSPTLLRLDRRGNPIRAGNLPLQQAFFNPPEILDNGGIDPLLRGLASQVAQEVDPLIVDDVRNFLFGPPGSGGLDLAALNMQRGRDHGLASYNQARADHGLPRVTSFAQITSNPALQSALQSTYGSVEDIDPWMGGLAEDHVPGALVGPLIRAVLADQFERLRDGDRFWYEIYLPPPLQQLVEKQTLDQIIRRNTRIRNELQKNVFIVPSS